MGSSRCASGLGALTRSTIHAGAGPSSQQAGEAQPEQQAEAAGAQGGVPKSASGRPQIANMPQPTGNTIADVKLLIETSDSHSALLRELLFTSPENGGTGKVREGARNDPLVSEVKAEILQVRAKFHSAVVL